MKSQLGFPARWLLTSFTGARSPGNFLQSMVSSAHDHILHIWLLFHRNCKLNIILVWWRREAVVSTSIWLFTSEGLRLAASFFKARFPWIVRIENNFSDIVCFTTFWEAPNYTCDSANLAILDNLPPSPLIFSFSNPLANRTLLVGIRQQIWPKYCKTKN